MLYCGAKAFRAKACETDRRNKENGLIWEETMALEKDAGRFPLSAEKMPKHIAIIMDGNGRWAKKRGLPRKAGHKAGAETLEKIISAV